MKNEPSAIEALNWRNDLDIIKINLENLTETCGLNAQEIAILLARVSRVKDFIKQALKKAEAYDRVVVPLIEARGKLPDMSDLEDGKFASLYYKEPQEHSHYNRRFVEFPYWSDVRNGQSEKQARDALNFLILAANLISKEMKGGE